MIILKKIIKSIFIILFIILLNNCKINNSDKIITKPVKGVLDLSNWNFDKKGLIKLHGEWEFYWNHHIEFDKNNNSIKPETVDYQNVPSTWIFQKINNKKLPGFGYCSYRLLIKNINTAKPISIKIGEIVAAYSLYINGKKIISSGKPGNTKKRTIPQFYAGSSILGIPEKNLEIIINVSNYQYFSGGIPFYIYLGSTEYIKNFDKLIDMIHNFILGCLFIIALSLLVLFFLNKDEISSLYFSLLCINTFFMLLFYMHYPTANFFASHINWVIIFYLQLLPPLLFFITLCLYVYSLFKEDFNKTVLKALLLIYLLINIVFIINHPITGKLPSLFFSIIIFTINLITYLYIIYVVIKAVINKRQNAVIFLVMIIIIFIAHFNHAAMFLMISEIINIFPYALTLFIIIQIYFVSYRYSKSFKEIKNLSLQLKNINLNLEKKVEIRTKQLKEVNEQKTNVFINIAHETKTPLTLINNYIKKFIKKYGTSEEILIIENNVNKLTNDIINFMDIQKLERGQIFYNHDQITNITEILKTKIKLFEEIAWNNNIIIICKNIKNNYYVKIDPYAMERIINNLLDNAVKYNKPFGKIKLSLVEKKDKIDFMIYNTGCGISEEHQENIFNPYYQISHKKMNKQGIGMGLNIIKNIVNDINGEIKIRSILNEFAEFKIIFNKYSPKKYEVIENIKESENSINRINIILKEEKYNNNKKNILLVEDNIQMLAFLQDTFYDDYNVYMAKNGTEALKRLDEISKINIIISDIMMDGIDGYELFEKIENNTKYNGIPFIFLTALTSNLEKIKGLKKGAIDYIYKPFDIEELKNKVKSLIKLQSKQKINNLTILSEKFYKILNEEHYEKNNNILKFKINENKKINQKEQNIINLLIKGYQYKQIAAKLNVSIGSLKTRINRIYKKLNIKNKVELINKIKK